MCEAIKEVAEKAVIGGLKVPDHKIGVIAPAYGAIPFSLVLAAALEDNFRGKIFFPARTELKPNKNGTRQVHYLPDKLKKKYDGCSFLLFEDIVNNSTTIREVANLFRTEVDAIIIGALAFVNRGGQTAKSLGVHQFFPLENVEMSQCDPRHEPCPLCQKGVPINTDLGKGKEWVAMFGQPPYSKNMNFSKFFID